MIYSPGSRETLSERYEIGTLELAKTKKLASHFPIPLKKNFFFFYLNIFLHDVENDLGRVSDLPHCSGRGGVKKEMASSFE